MGPLSINIFFHLFSADAVKEKAIKISQFDQKSTTVLMTSTFNIQEFALLVSIYVCEHAHWCLNIELFVCVPNS